MNVMVRDICHDIMQNCRTSMYPSLLIGHTQGETVLQEESDHSFGVVTAGELELVSENAGTHVLKSGMYFSSPGPTTVRGGGTAALFVRKGYRGLFQIGGPTEPFGRLCYIDNCRTTVLVCPPRAGDPVLNLLTFPAGIRQTPHIHPTIRLGAVLAGSGRCVLADGKKIDLKPGMAFYLGEGLIHCFHSDEALQIIAYHPDSDEGFTDQKHPMLSRTYITP
jgi:quercetin dioxygenase-like cupin family protein